MKNNINKERIRRNNEILIKNNIVPKFKVNDEVLYLEYISPYLQDKSIYPYHLYKATISEISFVRDLNGVISIEYFIDTKRGGKNRKESFLFHNIEDFTKNALIEP
jgi:hypothetical protein